MRTLPLFSIFALALVATCMQTPEALAGSQPLRGTIVANASSGAGQKLYSTYCGSCHGDTGMGDGRAAASLDPAPLPLHKAIKGKSDEALKKVLNEGKGQMPGWDRVLKPAQIELLIDYMKTLGKEKR